MMASKGLKYPFIDGCKNLPNDKDEDVKKLRIWLQSQPHLPELTDEHLHLFLYVNDYNLEDSKNNIEAYITIRSTSPEIFSGRSPFGNHAQIVWKMAYYGRLQTKTPEGYQVFIIRFSDPDPRKFVHVDCVKTMMMSLDILISENDLCPGYILIFDTKGISFGHFIRFNVSVIAKTMKYIQEGIPIRLKGMYVVNAVGLIDMIFNLFKPFLKPALLNMIHFYGSDLTELYKLIPQQILPEEYGGHQGTMQSLHEDFVKLATTKYSKWVEEEKLRLVDTPKNNKGSKKSFLSFW